MKKLVLICSTIFVLSTSFVKTSTESEEIIQLDNYLLDEPVINPNGEDVESLILNAVEAETESGVIVEICPGTGYACVIKGKSKDGDPTYFASLKGKNRKNIEILIYN